VTRQSFVIHLEATAPAKPATGQPCNGCGVCCALEPCPLGAVLSRRRRGACVALTWDGESARYRCGVVTDPRQYLPWFPAPWTRRLTLRWISAARGCDADLSVSGSG